MSILATQPDERKSAPADELSDPYADFLKAFDPLPLTCYNACS